jgi:hypothetical protein
MDHIVRKFGDITTGRPGGHNKPHPNLSMKPAEIIAAQAKRITALEARLAGTEQSAVQHGKRPRRRA